MPRRLRKASPDPATPALGDPARARHRPAVLLPRHQREISRAVGHGGALRLLGALRRARHPGAGPARAAGATRRCSGRRACRAQIAARRRSCSARPFQFPGAEDTLQLAETTSISFFAPMVITALAGPLLGEWAGWRRWLAVLAGFAGVLVITRPGVGLFGIGHVYALAAMFCYCFYVIMTRHMSATETPESLIFYSALAPVVLMLPVGALHGIGCRRTPSTGCAPVARLLRRLRPLAADQGLPAGNDDGARALSLSADGLDDRPRLSRLRPVSRTAGRSAARRSSWRAASTSSIASTGCG